MSLAPYHPLGLVRGFNSEDEHILAALPGIEPGLTD